MKFSILILIIVVCLSVSNGSTAQTTDVKIWKHPISEMLDTNLILPPAWAFGILYGGYTNQKETIERVKEIKRHDYPIDAYWIDSWFWSYADKGRGPIKYIDFIADTIDFPDRSEMWAFLEANNIKGGFWTWDCILETGNEKAFNDFNSKGYFSNTYIETGAWHNNSRSTAMFEAGSDPKKGTLCGNINFDDPEAVAYFKKQMKHFFDEGADFIKLDRTSRISTCKAMFEMSQEYGKETKGRGFLLSHSFETDNEEYKRYPAKWTDDTRSDWNVEKPTLDFPPWVPNIAFRENIEMYTDSLKKSSKIPFLTNDLGGFDMGKTDKPDEELFIRWLQFSIFCPIVEVFCQPENPTSQLAWLYSERADTIFRYYSHLRMKLFPYLYSYAHITRLKSENMIRKVKGQLYEYMLGNEILVAPVYEKGATTRQVYLPEGKWINYWTGEIIEGDNNYCTAAPLNQIPLFVRMGSVIPMRSYSASIEKGTNKTIILHIYPGENGIFNLLEDDGTSNDYLNGVYASTIIDLKEKTGRLKLRINPVSGNYDGMNSSREWILHIHCNESPKEINLNRENVKFTYDKLKKVTIAESTQQSVNNLLNFKVRF
jgi:alpha-glucosidase (family GH31 glycosyl hydrolase)